MKDPPRADNGALPSQRCQTGRGWSQQEPACDDGSTALTVGG